MKKSRHTSLRKRRVVCRDFGIVNTLDAVTFGTRKGRGCVKEKPFAGFSFALSEADNPAAAGGCRRQP